jgi:hypothetical protein
VLGWSARHVKLTTHLHALTRSEIVELSSMQLVV